MSNFIFIRKKYLTETELEAVFNILSNNMQSLGFDINQDNKKIWQTNFTNSLSKDNQYCYLIYKQDFLCGYIQVGLFDNLMHIHEVELSNQFKQTRLIIEIIKFLINDKHFKTYNEFYYSVNKKNPLSFKTFAHLGGIKIKETETKNFYKITRKSVEDYINAHFK
ncbi:MAG: hypothetical protein IKM43_03885 [Clostridia bacterium]|nr:hypothetical protein [Clostridia bacterium]